jgi:hypothetical protein
MVGEHSGDGDTLFQVVPSLDTKRGGEAAGRSLPRRNSVASLEETEDAGLEGPKCPAPTPSGVGVALEILAHQADRIGHPDLGARRHRLQHTTHRLESASGNSVSRSCRTVRTVPSFFRM